MRDVGATEVVPVLEQRAAATSPAERVYERVRGDSVLCPFFVGLEWTDGERAEWEVSGTPPQELVVWGLDGDIDSATRFVPEPINAPAGMQFGSPTSDGVVTDASCRFAVVGVPSRAADGLPGVQSVLVDLSADANDVLINRSSGRLFGITDGVIELADGPGGELLGIDVTDRSILRRWRVPSGYRVRDVSDDGYTLLLGSNRISQSSVLVQQGWSEPIDVGLRGTVLAPSGNVVAYRDCPGLIRCDIVALSAVDGSEIDRIDIGPHGDLIIGFDLIDDNFAVTCTVDGMLVADLSADETFYIERFDPPASLFPADPRLRRCQTTITR